MRGIPDFMKFNGSVPEAVSLSGMEASPKLGDASLVTERAKRAGIFTASQLYKIITPALKKPDNATFRQYIAEKAWERITGVQAENASGARATEWGHEHESQALFEFTIQTGIAPDRTGITQEFFKKEGYPFGATPDGIVSDDLGNRTHVCEVKCPFNGGIHLQNVNYASDVEWFKANRFEYYAQVQGAMWAAEVEKAYFISYDPGTSRERDETYRIKFQGFDDYKLFWTEISRDENFIEGVKEAIKRAEEDLLKLIAKR